MTPEIVPVRIALAGSPNCGKTALFNAITGGRQKVGNYAGVTVEKKEGTVQTPGGLTLRILDLPGTYSLDARTLDEAVTRDVLFGKANEEEPPAVLIAVVDATNLERNLGLILDLKELGRPLVLALNMMDLAIKRGQELDLKKLSAELGIPVIPTVAVKNKGIQELLVEVEKLLTANEKNPPQTVPFPHTHSLNDVRVRFKEVDRIIRATTIKPVGRMEWTDRIDRIVVHPLWGTALLAFILAFMFQAIFSWAKAPQEWIQAGVDSFGDHVTALIGSGPLQSLLVDGIISGVGAVVVFLPQILLLFLFILALEDSGYMARAAFLMDRLMGRIGLNGKAFIPLLSSHACAIPGIMATRTIESPRDRLTTILVAPLTTCSARLPVYSLLIAAFIPNKPIFGPLKLQGLVMFGLYAAGIFAALAMALVFKSTLLRGKTPALLMELPTYKRPSLRNIGLGLWERCQLFLRRAGTVILTLSILIWFLSTYPKPPVGSAAAQEPAINYSYAGYLGHALEPLVRPLGFDWRIAVALIPGFAAREVMVGALATVYAVETNKENKEQTANALTSVLSRNWSVATGISLLVWYILACQCLSTLAVTRRETNSWRWPAVMLGYMTVLAYVGSFLAYNIALKLGLG